MQLAKKLIIANWKSNKSITEAEHWMTTFLQQERRTAYEHVVCPSYAALQAVAKKNDGAIALGVQDFSPYGAGAYTGEISGANLEGLPITYAILGHSERRRYLGEDAQLIGKKVVSALDAQITPVICIDRDQIQTQANQIDSALYDHIILAYEPVHAISTFGGKEDPIEVTLEAISHIREEFGDSVPVLYGGSVDSENSLTYLGQDSINGLLVGGASLDPITFAQI